MLVLTRTDVAVLVDISAAIRAVEKGFRLLAAGEVTLPQRVATPLPAQNGVHLSMPVYLHGEPGTLAVKVVTVFRQNGERYGLPAVQGILLLHDATTGRLLALMDAEHLTALRTGAASGIATQQLARADARSLVIFGAGALAPLQAAAVCAVRPIERITIVSQSGERDAALCARLRRDLGVDAISTREIQPAVEQADVICTATTSVQPLFDGAWVRPGTHVNGVGSYTRTMRELDERLIRRARVFVDRFEAAEAEAGDIVLAAQDGAPRDLIAGELGDLLLGRLPGRQNDDEITLFKSVGLAMQDAVVAAQVYAAAAAGGVGRQLDLDGRAQE